MKVLLRMKQVDNLSLLLSYGLAIPLGKFS